MSPRDVQITVDQATVAPYLGMPYTRLLIPDPEEGGFIAEVLELPGCLSQGETPDEAFNNLDDAMGGYIASLLDRGYSVPEPLGMKEYPGRFLLRISSELHRGAATRAMYEGVSLNQWIGQTIADKLAAKSLADEVVAKLRAGPPLRIDVSASVAATLEFGNLRHLESHSNDAGQSAPFPSADNVLSAPANVTKQIAEGKRGRNA